MLNRAFSTYTTVYCRRRVMAFRTPQFSPETLPTRRIAVQCCFALSRAAARWRALLRAVGRRYTCSVHATTFNYTRTQ
eukprot:10788918-Lingulodinium_polyedra.AAC.1